MTQTHTPAPGAWVNGGKGGLTVATKAEGGNLGETIAVCADEEIMSGDAQANARLIAAAPDLLEALKMLVLGADNDISTDEIRAYIHKEARAAIARAEGN